MCQLQVNLLFAYITGNGVLLVWFVHHLLICLIVSASVFTFGKLFLQILFPCWCWSFGTFLLITVNSFLSLSSPEDMLIEFYREGKEGRETSTGCLLYTPCLGTEPAIQACALTRIQTHDFLIFRTVPQPTELLQPVL